MSFSFNNNTPRIVSRRRRSPAPLRRRLFLESLEDRRVFALAAPVDYVTGSNLQAIVTADFNNDAILDIASASYGDGTISILLGNSDGSFQPALTALTGVAPLSIAVGDLDNDGNLDLATANAYDVSILQGHGDGSFALPHSVSVPHSPSSVALGDFTGDGKLDLGVTSNYRYSYYGNYYYDHQGVVSVLIGDGTGNLSVPESIWLGPGFFGSATAVNLDGDSADELLVTNSESGYYYGAVALLEADLAGNLRVSNAYLTGLNATDIAVGDVNLDGIADFVTADSYYGSVSVLLGDGLGGYGVSRSFAAGNSFSYLSSVMLGDFSGDGKLDIAVADLDSGTNLNVLYGTGNGEFSVFVSFPASPNPWSVASGDFNDDGWLDAAVSSSYAGTVSVLLNDQSWPGPPPGLSINNVVVTEGNAGPVAAVFTVTRSGSLNGTTTVSYSTANDGAQAGSDYVAVSGGSLTFSPGEATKTVMILVNGDLTDEYDQGFYVNLSSPAGAVITDGSGFANILDDDDAPTINITPVVSQKEGNKNLTLFNFTVTLSAASEKSVSVNYSTANGTATAGTTTAGDYISKSGSLYFAPGETSKVIGVQVRGDRNAESNETFFVNLSGITNATLGTIQGIGEILDDDASRGKGKPSGGG